MNNKSYVGVTGFTTKDEVEQCLEVVPDAAERLFMTGVLLSSKTINGGTNKYPVRYPHYKNIAKIFSNDSRCLNLIHYVTDNKETLVKQLLTAAEIGGENCHGFQLNIAWPNIEQLKEVRRELPNHKFVIQCSNSAIKKLVVEDFSIAELVWAMIVHYEQAGVIDYLLIDPSGGRGVGFDAEATVEMLSPHLKQASYCLGIAGGLKEETIVNLFPVLSRFPALFWDAEGGLRDTNDNLIMSAAKRYVKASFGLDALLAKRKQ